MSGIEDDDDDDDDKWKDNSDIKDICDAFDEQNSGGDLKTLIYQQRILHRVDSRKWYFDGPTKSWN